MKIAALVALGVCALCGVDGFVPFFSATPLTGKTPGGLGALRRGMPAAGRCSHRVSGVQLLRGSSEDCESEEALQDEITTLRKTQEMLEASIVDFRSQIAELKRTQVSTPFMLII